MAFEEFDGKTGAVEFWQTVAGIVVKVGVTNGETVTGSVCTAAHGNKTKFGVNI